MGLLCVPFVLTAPPGERATVVGYVAITLALAASLLLVRGKTPRRRIVHEKDDRVS